MLIILSEYLLFTILTSVVMFLRQYLSYFSRPLSSQAGNANPVSLSEQKTYHKKATGIALGTVKRHSREHELKLFGSCFWSVQSPRLTCPSSAFQVKSFLVLIFALVVHLFRGYGLLSRLRTWITNTSRLIHTRSHKLY